jgi:hypothetical protein
MLAVVAGAGLLGWSTAGVHAVSGNLAAAETAAPASTPAPVDVPRVDLNFDHDRRGHHGRPGV